MEEDLKRIARNNDNAISENAFRTPDMGDFYLGAVDCTFLNKIDEMVNGEENADHENAAFYTESPKKDVGTENENEAFVGSQIEVSQESIDKGLNNGNTLRMGIDALQGPNADAIKQSLTDKIGKDAGIGNMNIRLVGIAAPQTPVWAYEKKVLLSAVKQRVKKYGDVKNSDSYTIASGGHHSDEAQITFIRVGDRWYEVDAVNNPEDGETSFRWCLYAGDEDSMDTYNEDNGQTRYDAGDMKAAINLKRLIENAGGEVYFDIDKSPNGFPKRFEAISKDPGAMAILKSWHDNGGGSDDGWTIVQEDDKANFMAVAYIKQANKWVNLAKAALTDESNDTIAPDTSYNGKLKDEFKPGRYDKDSITYADAYYHELSSLDDRHQIQREVFGMDWEDLNDWTMTIGDVTLFVPPINISVVTETEKQEIPLLRANGAMHKVGKRVVRHISMDLFFNEDRGINGYKIDKETPSGQKVTYSINGLRSLIGQFKFIPFIPIENSYVNNTLHIQAVTIENMVVSSVPGFPKLIQAKIIMTEFNYGVYMPEAISAGMALDEQNGENEFSNYFAATFNWKTARWYYQRALMKGDDMKGMKFNSDSYNIRMIQNRTALIPMSFMNPDVTFYLANAEYLDEMMEARMQKKARAIKFDKYEKEGLKKLGIISDCITEAQNDSQFQAAVAYLKDHAKQFVEVRGDTSNALWGYGGRTYDELRGEDIGCIYKSDLVDSECNEAENTAKLNEALAVLQEYVRQANEKAGEEIISYPRFEHYVSGDRKEGRRASWGISFHIDIDAIDDKDKREEIKANIAAYIGCSTKSFYNDNRVYLPISATLGETNDEHGRENVTSIDFDNSYPDVMFLAECKKQSEAREDPDTKSYAQIDQNQLENLYYDKYASARVTAWSASLTNHISRMNVCDLSGASPQYLGGDDISLSIDITTTSAEVVDKMNALPTICAAFGRRYRAVMPSSVVKIQSEFAQFFGINEVLINDVQIETMPGMPNVWTIHVDLTSDDRTLRTREALNKIEGTNAGVIDNGESFGDVMSWDYSQTSGTWQGENTSTPKKDSLAARTMQTYFDLNKTIAKAELYPDLELPTLEEMENAGWDFVRYKFQDDRVYVDPDFYFIYANNLSSQILREYLLAKSEGEEAQLTYCDSQGGKMEIEPASRNGFNIISRNDVAQQQKDQSIQLQNAQNRAKAKELKENLKKDIDVATIADAASVDNFESWEICDDIKASYMEERYKKEYDSYNTRIRAENVTSNYQAQQSTVQSPGGNVPDNQQSEPEGKWVNSQLENARRASKAIDEYLATSIPDSIVVPDAPMVAQERTSSNALSDQISTTRKSAGNTKMKNAIYDGVRKFFADGKVIEIFSCINADVTDEKFLAIACDIVYSAACAATGEKEFSNKQKSTGWMPAPDFFGYKVGDGQDAANREQAHNTEEAIEYATEFGCFGIKQYTSTQLQKITNEKADDVWGGSSELNATHYLLDPYYRYLSLDSNKDNIKRYKKGCINNPTYCTFAYLRLCMYWLKRLIDCQAFPSISGDVLRNSVDHELSILKQQQENNAINVKGTDMLAHITFFRKRAYALDAGKLWSAAILASGDGNEIVMKRIKDRDYRALNGYISGLSRPENSVPKEDEASLATRKMILALIGTGRIKNSDAIGVPQDKEASKFMSNLSEKKYIEAAEDPATYCMHACHDMIVYDARGRMLRAFPTYYMLFIDEGREVGMWKLHDNFYNSMAIASIEVVKSRKMPADTAHIVMSNFYKSFMTEGEDYSQTKIGKGSWNDTFASVFGPIPGVNKIVGAITGQELDSTTYGQRLEAERQKKPPEDRVRLRAGARIHIRMGYGSNAVMLPVVFNGCIAEVTSEECVEIVAQGDGIELMNPIMEDSNDAADTVHEDEFVCLPSNGETPKNIINAYLTNIGGKTARALKAVGAQNLLGRSPYGIYHFGNPDYKELFSKGEPTQNIFEACAKPAWGSDTSATASYGLDAAPEITFDTFQKTVWDVANICRSVTPDFICGVAPFDYRSTLFVGHPRYYYAYSYCEATGGLGIQEKRKPYQQFHIYDSATDIIGNGIIATKSKMKTVALGLYTKVESMNIKNQEQVGPLYADIDIYPENQKTMIVDTQLMGKGASWLGALTNSVSQRFDSIKDENSSREKIAWRMTASALKDSVKEMYAGDLVIIGDASVKPHDRIAITDTYQGISGQATVKEVVLSMSVDKGFITTISPDCICTVDDRFENVVHPWLCQKSTLFHVAAGMLAMNVALLFAGRKAGQSLLSARGIVRGAKKAILNNPLSKGLLKDTKIAKSATKATLKTARKAKKLISGLRVAGVVVGELLLGPAGWGALLVEVLGLIASVAVGKFINAFLEMTMKNLQVLQIYPLKRYGLCWTAGVEGSKGLVVGSPSHAQQGALTEMMANLFGSDPNGIAATVGSFFADDSLSDVADKYKEQIGVIGEDGEGTDTTSSYSETIARQSVQMGEVPNDYRAMEIVPRIVYDLGSNDFIQTREHFAIMNKENWMNDSRLQHVKLVSQDPRLKPYMDEVPRFFRIIHEEPALNKDSRQVDTLTLSKNGSRHYIKAMHQPLGNGGECLDVPMLHEEAMNILYEIVRRAKLNMPTGSDQNENYEKIKGSFIALESALRIGDNESMGSTGFTFILEGSEQAAPALAAAITELSQEIENDAKENGMRNAQIFTSQPQGGNKVAINVLMPKLSNEKYRQEEGEEV